MIRVTGWKKAQKERGDSVAGQGRAVQALSNEKFKAAILLPKELEQGRNENGKQRRWI